MSLNPGIEHIGPPVERAGKVQPISNNRLMPS